jgi:hypothetical protein
MNKAPQPHWKEKEALSKSLRAIEKEALCKSLWAIDMFLRRGAVSKD